MPSTTRTAGERSFTVDLVYRLLHNSPGTSLGKAYVRVCADGDVLANVSQFDFEAASVALPGFASDLKVFARRDAKKAVIAFLSDTKHPVTWREDSAIECTVRETTR